MTQLTKVKQNTHEHKDKSCNPKKHSLYYFRLSLVTLPVQQVLHDNTFQSAHCTVDTEN